MLVQIPLFIFILMCRFAFWLLISEYGREKRASVAVECLISFND